MGGSNSEEFMVASEVGEEYLLLCDECGYRANQEKAEYQRVVEENNEDTQDLKEVSTPDVKTIDDLESFFGCSSARFLKSIIYVADKEPVMAIVTGNRDVNEYKLKNYLGAVELELAGDDVVTEITGAPVGFAGPVGNEKVRKIFDLSVKFVKNAITGANKKDIHFSGINAGRNFEIEEEADITSAVESDICPKCGKPMYVKKGIEVGHIFKLGYKYTEAMKVTVLDERGKAVTPIMGCYGIGVNRTMAAIVDQYNDDRGIIWPDSVTPFQVHLIGIAKTDEEKSKVEDIYNEIKSYGYDVLYDDRKVSPGFKFADADLIGIPFRITAGKSFFQSGEIEIKYRKSGEMQLVARDKMIDKIKEYYK